MFATNFNGLSQTLAMALPPIKELPHLTLKSVRCFATEWIRKSQIHTVLSNCEMAFTPRCIGNAINLL